MTKKTQIGEGAMVEYVTAMIGGQLFGLPISRVQDVFMPERVTRVPLASREIAGVLNLRGRIVTVVDMRSRLGLPTNEDGKTPMAVGVALLAGARFDRWFWGMFVAGITGAVAFVVWLFTQSVFVIGVLCPYCLVVWAAVIPMFWATLLWAFGTGKLTRTGSGLQRRVARLMPFGWAFVVASYAAIALTILAVFRTLPASLGWL